MRHTYVLLELSGPAFAEICTKLAAAGHTNAIHGEEGREVVDMHGLAVTMDPTPRPDVDIELASILSHSTKEGKVELKVNGETVQMSLDKAREVHGMLASAIEAAVSDQLVYAFLTQTCGFRDDMAARALLDFRELRQGTRGVVRPH